MKRLVGHIAIGLMVALLGQTQVFAMSSSNYQINWDNINGGGNDTSSSASYSLQDTIGDTATGQSSSATYTLRAGYRQTDEAAAPPAITVVLKTQSNATQVTYSAFSNGSKTVTVSELSGFTVGDYIGVIENQGGGQLLAIGKVTIKASPTGSGALTVDKWSGDHATINASPSGGDDYVYILTGSTAALGTLTSVDVKTSVTMVDVSTTSATGGYVVTIVEDGNLRTVTADDINDVSDGTVTAGSEEYGIDTVGDNATGTGDFAITGTPTNVASSGSNGTDSRTGMMYQASISATAAGSYAHTVTYIATSTF